MSRPPAITVIIVAYNSGAYLQPCVDALSRQSFEDFEAVIVDNASTDGAVEALSLPDDRFRVDRPGENLGFAGANNRVARAVTSPWIALLNPDTRVAPDWLEALMRGHEAWPDCPAFGSTQLRLDEPDILDGAGDVWFAGGVAWRALEGRPVQDNPPDGETFAPCGAAAFYDRARFVELGGFDERFFCYCEDVDYGYRVRLTGQVCIQLTDAVVYHAGSGTTGRHSEFTLFHGHRNRIWVFFKNTPAILLPLLVPVHLAVNAYLYLRADGERRAYLKRAYRAAWDGLGAVMAQRRSLSRLRTGSIRALMRAMIWSPRLVTRRGVKLDRSGARATSKG
ncbi:MAG: glycosyl transferase [Oceanicaulis sp.]|uniref:glycosyltransferase family 2 protein n=1 Tax=unclassified Oceanicaulis TaxID=2632123 RepID=UPI000C609F5C|nr:MULTISPECIES: glycosyltransferase family 2 protein [unclassified Oceanicaulis]MAB68962.1 glycosyl transferase [Oceanicaulis sp.]MBC38231.1 glycosyl transferase [Oceanicaulis sp.]MBG34246.1 glycosyl transferase [Oceanicaulis sp.]HBU63670.1 glycosyltransferase family 2 protein [Oceanicaulis sp.]HCR94444.1 glycosyltransferase family 2 protein [Oceanicaulis sp.]|tara:strand:- start:546 stop:1556 length:1011 start_codon:yes stop_codon:yes gene_type:complete